MTFKVGDRLTLTGKEWIWDGMTTGDVVTVLEVDDNLLKFVGPEEWAPVNTPGFEVELNTDTPAEHFAESNLELTPVRGTKEHTDEEWAEYARISSFEENVRRHTNKIASLLIAKNKQYSNSALDPIRVFSKSDRMEQLRVRADDKLSRIRNGDTSEDALTDLAGYIVLMKIAEESE